MAVLVAKDDAVNLAAAFQALAVDAHGLQARIYACRRAAFNLAVAAIKHKSRAHADPIAVRVAEALQPRHGYTLHACMCMHVLAHSC